MKGFRKELGSNVTLQQLQCILALILLVACAHLDGCDTIYPKDFLSFGFVVTNGKCCLTPKSLKGLQSGGFETYQYMIDIILTPKKNLFNDLSRSKKRKVISQNNFPSICSGPSSPWTIICPCNPRLISPLGSCPQLAFSVSWKRVILLFFLHITIIHDHVCFTLLLNIW